MSPIDRMPTVASGVLVIAIFLTVRKVVRGARGEGTASSSGSGGGWQVRDRKRGCGEMAVVVDWDADRLPRCGNSFLASDLDREATVFNKSICSRLVRAKLQKGVWGTQIRWPDVNSGRCIILVPSIAMQPASPFLFRRRKAAAARHSRNPDMVILAIIYSLPRHGELGNVL